MKEAWDQLPAAVAASFVDGGGSSLVAVGAFHEETSASHGGNSANCVVMSASQVVSSAWHVVTSAYPLGKLAWGERSLACQAYQGAEETKTGAACAVSSAYHLVPLSAVVAFLAVVLVGGSYQNAEVFVSSCHLAL